MRRPLPCVCWLELFGPWSIVEEPFRVLVVELIVLGACILWAPCGAALSARYASRGTELRQLYILRGVVYSALFFVPWLYFLARLRNYKVWTGGIWVAYVLLYVGWLLGPVAVALLFLFLSAGVSHPLAFVFGPCAVAIGGSWCVSLFLLLDNTLGSRSNVDGARAEDARIRGVFLAPLWLFFMSLLLAGTTLAILWRDSLSMIRTYILP